jgi:hypothetical protein
VTGRPVLGDFLAAAHRHLDRAAAQSRTSAPGRDAEEITASLRRLIMALAGYTADLTTSFGELLDPDLKVLNAYARAAIQARDALSSAASTLGSAGAGGEPVSGLGRQFDAATLALLAGRDLLQTHFASDRDGRRRGRSSWAQVITSPSVTRGLLAEVAALSRRTSAAGAAAVPAGQPWPAAGMGRLHLACQWLALAGASGDPAYQHEPVSAAERDLLRAIPGSALPPRRLPEGSELVPELCEAVIAASQRVSQLAWSAAGAAPESPAISVTSWRRIASAGTATSHHCHLVLTALAVRATPPSSGPKSTIGSALDRAAADARLTRAAWLRTGRALSQVTTDIRWRTSRTAAEAGDLALWTGKLAYASPSWRLSDGPDHPARRPEHLAPDPADIPELVAAIHYTTETLERLAVSSEQQIRGAVRAHRVLMPARSFPDGSDTIGRFAPAPEDRTHSLLAACHGATTASNRTLSTLAGIAGEVRASSRILTTARVAARPSPRAAASPRMVAEPAAGPDRAAPDPAGASAGPVEARLRDLGVTSPRLLWRASGVDQLARQVIAEAAGSRRSAGVTSEALTAGPPGMATLCRRTSSAVRGRAGVSQGQPEAARQEPEAEP